MIQDNSNSALHTTNTVIMWLFCLTVLALIIPWEVISTDLAYRIESNKICLYFALIIEISNFITQGIITIVNSILKKKYSKKLTERIIKSVASFDFAERALLREYVLQRQSVLTLPVLEPTVRNLIDDGVLTIVSVLDEDDSRAKVIISKEARPYITYKAIGLTLGKMSEEQVSQIINARPDYAKQKFSHSNKIVLGSSAIRVASNNQHAVKATAA